MISTLEEARAPTMSLMIESCDRVTPTLPHTPLTGWGQRRTSCPPGCRDLHPWAATLISCRNNGTHNSTRANKWSACRRMGSFAGEHGRDAQGTHKTCIGTHTQGTHTRYT